MNGSLGARIAKLRRSRGLSHDELAEQSGVRAATLIQVELGRMRDPALSIVARIATTLQASIDELAR